MDYKAFCRKHADLRTLAGTPTTEAEILSEISRVGIRTCPNCPDGFLWTSSGPTTLVCRTCYGFARVIETEQAKG